MPLPETLATDKNICDFAARWTLRLDVAAAALSLARAILANSQLRALIASAEAIKIISGYRTEDEQDSIRNSGSTTTVAPRGMSTHTSCPATGFDLRIEGWMGQPGSDRIEAIGLWKAIGEIGQRMGLRWGGGSRLTQYGIPLDYNHFDLGPRQN